MRISSAYPGNWLKAADLQGRVAQVTMSHIKMEEVEKGTMKPVLYFTGKELGLALNKTNAGILEALYGDETDRWIGQPIELYVDPHVQYQGRTVEGLRVRGVSTTATTTPAAAQAPYQPGQVAPQIPTFQPGQGGAQQGPQTGQTGSQDGGAPAIAPPPVLDDEIPF